MRHLLRRTGGPLAAALLVTAIVVVGCGTGPGVASGAASPTTGSMPATTTAQPTTAAPSRITSPSASNVPAEFPDGPMPAGTYTVAPFESTCLVPPQPGCTDTADVKAIQFTITVPDGWSGLGNGIGLTGPENHAPDDGAGLLVNRGAWLFTDPCQSSPPDIPVGPTVADFVDAVAKHPILDTTTPVDVTLAGYSGKYFDLQIPADISTDAQPKPECPHYHPWEPGIYAQGPSQRWHQWVIDVDGVRVVVQSFDYPGTSATHVAELRQIVDSIQIEP